MRYFRVIISYTFNEVSTDPALRNLRLSTRTSNCKQNHKPMTRCNLRRRRLFVPGTSPRPRRDSSPAGGSPAHRNIQKNTPTPRASSSRARTVPLSRPAWRFRPTRPSTVMWKTSTTRRASGASSCKAGVRGRLHFLFLHECNELMISIASSVDMLTYIIASV